MELRHLRYFIAAAEEEHFGRAASRLHVTRPAVSQILADLESELGVALFDRLAHRVQLTAAGKAFLPHVRGVMSDLNQAVAMTRRVSEGRVGALSIGYGSLTLLHPLFRESVRAYTDQYPEVTLSLIEMPSYKQPKALADGRIHVGFRHYAAADIAPRQKRKPGDVLAQDVVVEDFLEIQKGGLGLVVPSDHRLANQKSVALTELAHERWVVIPQSIVSPGYGPLFALCQQAGFEPQVVQEVNSITTLLNLVSVGVGIGLSVIGAGFVFPPSLSVVEIKDVSYPNSFALSWVKGNADPPLLRFIETVDSLLSRKPSRARKSPR